MQVRFYAYRKRINSTKKPTQKDTEGQLSFFADCVLKDSTSVIAPQITLIFPHGLLSPSSYNYAYIPDFHRYYFVTDITFAQNRVLYTLACDVLASYWNTLKDTTQYVLRSASAGDLSVVDSLYPVTAEISYGGADVTGWKLPTLSSGYYVLGIVNNATNAVGGGEFKGGPGSLLASGGVITKAITVSNLARHPQIGRGRWLSLAPYSNYYLYYPPFGVIQLDPAKIVNSSISIGIRIDCVSGIGNITVSSGENLLYYAECQIGVDIQLSQVSYIGGIISDVENVIGAASSGAQLGLGGNAALSALGAAGNALGSIVTSNTFKGAVTGIASGETTFAGIGTAANAANGQLSVQGNNGNLSSYIIQPHIFWRFSHVVSNDNEDLGTPCCKKFKLSALSGFTTIMHPDIDTVLATQPEISALMTYMTNGFFIEGSEINDE